MICDSGRMGVGGTFGQGRRSLPWPDVPHTIQRAGGPRIYIYLVQPEGAATGTDAEDNMDQRCGECVTSSSHTVSTSSNSDAAELLDVDTERAGGPRIRMYIL